MHIWIDIDDESHIPLIKLISSKLKENGHTVILTTTKNKSMLEKIKSENIITKSIWYQIKIFIFLQRYIDLFRAALLLDYIKDRRVDSGFSITSNLHTSNSQFFACMQKSIPYILFVNNSNHYIDMLKIGYDKSRFIVSSTNQKQHLIDKGINTNNILVFATETLKENNSYNNNFISNFCDLITNASGNAIVSSNA